MNKLQIYCDGSCRRSKIGGYGYIVVNNNKIISYFIRREENTTNQRMELMALLSAFKYCQINKITNGEILSDSSYCLNCAFDKWYVRWEKNGFISAKRKQVLNQDLWKQIIPFYKEEKITLKKVPGHQDCYFNNVIDSLVTTISNSKTQDLTGKRFGQLKVISLCGNSFTHKINTTFWLCECDCGKQVVEQHSSLIYGNVTSCGCRTIEHYIDLSHQRFGFLEPLEKIGITSDNYALWKCKCHNCGSIINVSSRQLKKQLSCGCIKSKGEEKIGKILNTLKYNYKKEISFDNLVDSKPLKFDFGIFKDEELIALIEYQGLQHFYTTTGWNNEKHLELTKKHDKMKKDYCKNNNIKLVEILYTDYDKISENFIRQKIEGDAK